MMTARLVQPLALAVDHPALAGHFPTRPIYPGVVLLERVMAAFEDAWGAPVVELPTVKFLVPVRPGMRVTLSAERDAHVVKFELLTVDGARIATGTARLAGADA